MPTTSATTVRTVAVTAQRTKRGERVADDDRAAVRRREHQPPREAVLEVARDAEAGEDAAERGRLEEHEDELERRVPGRERRSRDVLELGEAADEGEEEEEREERAIGMSMFGVVSALWTVRQATPSATER